ncbi:hypothetical protein SAMN05661091_5557 [Paenibacillus uliginis N3/975]|uniref:Uncharacterized protein n=2 Tax=Paenibacillus TaxID=44249 RepID=A0A1X7HS55_9BACL|nr:hypothetical protein SAMN05661091_5557 [Paenibacillus uliginis N3/975]
MEKGREIEMTQKAFSIEINKATKTMEMMVSGTFTAQDYEDFVNDYVTKTSSIDASQYLLEVDCRMMDLLTPGEVDKLQGSFTRYKETGFAKVNFIVTESQSIIKMQLGRVARMAGLTNIEVIVK